MKVKELIDILLTQPKDAEVWTEGCDCYGRANDVTYDESDNTILINRDN